jgi:hypothetical protein
LFLYVPNLFVFVLRQGIAVELPCFWMIIFLINFRCPSVNPTLIHCPWQLGCASWRPCNAWWWHSS